MNPLRWLYTLPLLILLLAPGQAQAGDTFRQLLKIGNKLLRREAAVATRALLSSHKRLEDLHVLSLVVTHLKHSQAEQVQALLKRASAGEVLSKEQWALLDEVAEAVQQPLKEAAAALKSGKPVPLVGNRALQSGVKMDLGSAEHQAQCWLEYQLRHPDAFPEFSYAVDDTWLRRYKSILENAPRGGTFEREVIQAQRYEKNARVMMPPPGSNEPGFVPDALRDKVEELVWGRPYRFAEMKAWAELSLTGNLKGMIDYVGTHGGHLELWVRSAKHPEGPTKLSKPLQQALDNLIEKGKAEVKFHP